MANLDKDAVEREFVPCPTCKQYSHSIPDDKIAEAFRTFQSMFSHRNDGIPTQFCFDEKVRDAAQVLTALARQATEQVSDDAVLPCDVRLPPATTIAAGCKLGTLIHALECRGMATPAPNKAGQPSDDAVVERVARAMEAYHDSVAFSYNVGGNIPASHWNDLARAAIASIPTQAAPKLDEAVERVLHERFALFGINGTEIKEAAREIATMQSTDTEAVDVEADARAYHADQAEAVIGELAEALDDARLFIDLVRLRARRLGEVEQEIEAQDSLRNAEAVLAKLKERGQ
jgi:hypothetical protein